MAKAINDSVFDVSYGSVEPDNAPGAAGKSHDYQKFVKNLLEFFEKLWFFFKNFEIRIF